MTTKPHSNEDFGIEPRHPNGLPHSNDEVIEEFINELMTRARYVKGNQYPDGSEEYKAYQTGFESALAMVYIDLTGTPKSQGMLRTLLAQKNAAVEKASLASNLRAFDIIHKHIMKSTHLSTINTLEAIQKEILANIPPDQTDQQTHKCEGCGVVLDTPLADMCSKCFDER